VGARRRRRRYRGRTGAVFAGDSLRRADERVGAADTARVDGPDVPVGEGGGGGPAARARG
jgi:hypothetical protein